MLKIRNMGLNNVLFNNNKLINNKNNVEKNISEELLTFKTLILVAATKNETEELVQLGKILSACKLQQDTYKISFLTNDWAFYRNSENIKEVLLFGISEKELNISTQMPLNQIIKFDNRIWIKTTSISEMSNNQQIKNDLWQNALKPHFIGS
jgi:hypothetical protein